MSAATEDTPPEEGECETEEYSLEEHLDAIGDRIDDVLEGREWVDDGPDIVQITPGSNPYAVTRYHPGCEFVGHDMKYRLSDTGCRLFLWNSAQKCAATAGGESYVSALCEEFKNLAVDVAVILEPGKVRRHASIIRTIAATKYGFRAQVCQNTNTKGEGIIVITTAAWSQAVDKVILHKGRGHESERIVQVNFKEARTYKEHGYKVCTECGQPHILKEPLKQMAMFAVYSYSGYKTSATKAKALWRTVRDAKMKYQASAPFASIVIATDQNAAYNTMLDTWRECEDEEQLEDDAELIQIIQQMGVYDVFRAVHPKLQAVTRVPTGKQDQAARRLDAVYASKEMTDHPAVRAGIHMGHTN